MAIITDPDNLNQGTEVTFDTSAKTIALAEAGNLSSDGVTLKALYSFCKEEWKSDATLIKFAFPFVPITDEQFELVDGWDFANDASRYLVRTAGWTVKNTSGNVTQQWAGIIGLGTVDSGDQLYYDNSGTAVDFELTGQVNQAIQILDDPNGDGSYGDGFDRRTSFTMFVREQGQVFGQVGISDIGVSQMDSQAYRFPLTTSVDTNISASDATISTTAPYTGMSITYNATAQSRSIGGSSYDFGIIIDGNNGTAQEIYEFVQYQLRQNSDIDADASSLIGKTADELLVYVGSTLKTKAATNPDGGGTGVFIDNFDSNDTNNLEFIDNTGTTRTFPFVAAGTLAFNTNLVNDSDAVYRMFFTTNPGGDFGTSSAILVDNNSGTDISGNVSGSATVSWDFDYDNNVQGGRTAATDAAVTVVAIGLNTGQYVSTTHTITRSTGQTISLVSPLERNYDNS